MGFSFEPLRVRPDVWLRTPQVLKPIPARKPRPLPEVGLSLSDASNPPLAEQRKARAQFSAKRKPRRRNPRGLRAAGKVLAMLRPGPAGLFQIRAIGVGGMKHQHHFGGANDVALRDVARISALISDIDRNVRILERDIAAEEERARVSDHRDSAYPILARTLAARRDNLRDTIAALETRLASLLDRTEEVPLSVERPSRPKDNANQDSSLVDRMKELISSGRASSPSAAARLIHRYRHHRAR
jgi:hypothetical protein